MLRQNLKLFAIIAAPVLVLLLAYGRAWLAFQGPGPIQLSPSPEILIVLVFLFPSTLYGARVLASGNSDGIGLIAGCVISAGFYALASFLG